jgi:hypothetical protein
MSKLPHWLLLLFRTATLLLTLQTGSVFYIYSISDVTLCWLPLLPASLYVFVVYIDADIKNLSREVEQLEHLKYEFKKV